MCLPVLLTSLLLYTVAVDGECGQKFYQMILMLLVVDPADTVEDSLSQQPPLHVW